MTDYRDGDTVQNVMTGKLYIIRGRSRRPNGVPLYYCEPKEGGEVEDFAEYSIAAWPRNWE